MVRLSDCEGAIGMVVPSAFHANEGATGIRKLYLRQTRIEQCRRSRTKTGCSIFTHHSNSR
jgi:hypothetical protein